MTTTKVIAVANQRVESGKVRLCTVSARGLPPLVTKSYSWMWIHRAI